MRREHILSFVLVAHQQNIFSFLVIDEVQIFSLSSFLSGQGFVGNYKSSQAWPGLYNLCGIFVQPRRTCSLSNKPKPIFNEELSWKRMFQTHIRAWELDQSMWSALPSDTVNLLHELCWARVLYLSLDKHHSAWFFFSSTLSALLYSCAVVVNKAGSLASSFSVISSVLGKELWSSYVGQVRLLVLHHFFICIKSTQAF